MLCQNIKKIQLIYNNLFKQTYATTVLKWLVARYDLKKKKKKKTFRMTVEPSYGRAGGRFRMTDEPSYGRERVNDVKPLL